MPRIRLYTQKTNPYAEKVARALNFKGLEHERIVSDDPDDVARWSPVTKQLPVLEVNDERISDSSAILDRIEELFPEPPLLSPDPVTAGAQRRMAEWSDVSFVWYWNRWRAARFPQPGDEQPADRSLIRKFKSGVLRSLGLDSNQLTRLQVREAEIGQELSNRLDDLVVMLGARPFFHSDQLGLADLSVFGMLQVMRDSPMMGDGSQIDARPALVEYMERVEALTRRPRED